jgi:diacylglycerol kinase family enzyme
MAGFGVIVNPYARGNKRSPSRVERFRSIVGDDGVVFATEDFADLDQRLRELHDRGIDVLAVCGGDGSFLHVVGRAIELWGADDLPLLLPLRGGTINNLSRTIKARRRRAESMLAHVVKGYRRGRTYAVTQRDLVCVNGNHYGYLFGVGLVVNFLQVYYAGRRPGPLSAFRLLIRCGLSYYMGTSLIQGIVKSFEGDIEVDGERVPFRSFSMFLASSIEHIGLGVKPFYLSARKRGYYHVLGGPCTPGELLSRLYRFFRGHPANLDSLYDNLAQRVRIDFAEPQAFMINGDIFDPAEGLTLEPGPRVSFISG